MTTSSMLSGPGGGTGPSPMEAFEAGVAEIDEAIECRRMFGDPDYLLWVAVENLEAYERLYMGKLVGLPGMARTTSQLTLKTVKPGGRLPSVADPSAGRRGR
jgi:DNA-binding Lrp family transcriptional regulator